MIFVTFTVATNSKFIVSLINVFFDLRKVVVLLSIPYRNRKYKLIFVCFSQFEAELTNWLSSR